MSDPVRPHRWQPTRLFHHWDSPGENTGVGCHFRTQCMKVKREREVTQSCPTLHDPMDCSLPGSSVHGIFQARVLGWVAIAFSYSSIITLNVNGLNGPTKRQRLAEWIQNKTPIYVVYKRPTSNLGTHTYYQATNGIFQRTRTNNFTICMDIQKTSNSQCNLEKEEWNWRNQPAWL